jgi:hypothetical protein
VGAIVIADSTPGIYSDLLKWSRLAGGTKFRAQPLGCDFAGKSKLKLEL